MDSCDARQVVTAIRSKVSERIVHCLQQTPKALWRRIKADGAKDLKEILKRWFTEGFFIPPKNSQVSRPFY